MTESSISGLLLLKILFHINAYILLQHINIINKGGNKVREDNYIFVFSAILAQRDKISAM